MTNAAWDYKVGDLVDLEGHVYCIRQIVSLQNNLVQLKDPYTGNMEPTVQSKKKLRPFRLHTKCRERHSLANSNRRPRLDMSAHSELLNTLNDMIRDPLQFNAEQLVQFLRGKHYFFIWGLLGHRVEHQKTYRLAMEYFRLHLSLFVRFLQAADFSKQQPANIYASAMAALCSSYPELSELTESVCGLTSQFIQFRQFNVSFFKKEPFERELQEWVQGELLPALSQVNIRCFPLSFLINLISLLLQAVKVLQIIPSDPLVGCLQELYQSLMHSIDKGVPSNAALQQLYKWTPFLFPLLQAQTQASVRNILESSKTEKIVLEQGVPDVRPNNEVDQEDKQKSQKIQMTSSEKIKEEEIHLKWRVIRSMLVHGSRESVINDLQWCFNQIKKGLKVQEEQACLEENWPRFGRNFLEGIRASDFLTQVLASTQNFTNSFIHFRTLFAVAYVFLPRECLLACLSVPGRVSLFKHIIGWRTTNEAIISWLVEQLSKRPVQASNFKDMHQIMRFLQNAIKSKMGIIQPQKKRQIILRKFYSLAFSPLNRQIQQFSSLVQVSDPTKTRLLEQIMQSQILPICHTLMSNFSEYLLGKYLRDSEVREELFRRIIAPMLLPEKEVSSYAQRQDTIISILHNNFRRENKKNYFTLLSCFLDFYLDPTHDHGSSWSQFEVTPPANYSTSVKRAFLESVSEEFCEEYLPRLKRFSCELDIKVFTLLLWKINEIRGTIVIDQGLCDIQVVKDVPLYLEPLFEGFFYLAHEQNALLKSLLQKIFKLSNQKTYDRMLEIFLNVLVRHDCASSQANLLFRVIKTRCYAPLHKVDYPDYRIRFQSKTAEQVLTARVLEKKRPELAIVAEEQLKCKIIIEATKFDNFIEVKSKLCYRLNKDPSEVILLDKKGKHISDDRIKRGLHLILEEFVDSNIRDLRAVGAKVPEFTIIYEVIPENSAIHQCLHLQAETLLRLAPRSLPILAGIDFLLEDWKDFDDEVQTSLFFEDALNVEELPEQFSKTPTLLMMLLDYILWRKDPEEVAKYDLTPLLRTIRQIDRRDDLLHNYKVILALMTARPFTASVRPLLLDALVFADPDSLSKSRLDEETIYEELLTLVFRGLEKCPEDALEFCFTTDRLEAIWDCDTAYARFKKYWQQLYDHSSLEERTRILSDIERRVAEHPSNMRELASLIDSKQDDGPSKRLYEETLDRMARHVVELNHGRPSGHAVHASEVLLVISGQFIEKGFTVPFLQSRELLEFLLAKFYCYIYHLPSYLFRLIAEAAQSPQSLEVVASFFERQMDEPDWRDKSQLILSRRPRDVQTQGYVGLINCQNTCYANSLFQQLFHFVPFRRQLLAAEWQKKDIPEQDLLLQLKKIFIHLEQSRQPYENRSFFQHAFLNLDGQPVDVSNQMDVDEFRNMLFNYLQAILPKNTFWQPLMQGKQINRITCLECGNVSKTEQTFSSICLSVQDLSSLQESLADHNKPVLLQKDNAYSCDKCQSKVRAEKSCSFSQLPPCLIFVLKRFEYVTNYGYRRKLNNYFEFPERLPAESGQHYNLVGIISHLGYPDSGHYVSYRRIDGTWFEFNDSRVKQISLEQLRQNSFGSRRPYERSLLHQKTAYLLFYETEFTTAPLDNLAVVGVEQEQKRIRKEQILADKETAFFSRHYFQFLIGMAFRDPQPRLLRCLTVALIEVMFKLKQAIEAEASNHAEQLIRALEYLQLHRSSCSFVWDDKIRPRLLSFLALQVHIQFKIFMAQMLIQHVPQRSRIVEEVLEFCLISIHQTKQAGIFYFLMHSLCQKHAWVGQFLHQHRTIGRIMDISLASLLRNDLRQALRANCSLSFDKMTIQQPLIREQLRYHKWALLVLLIERFGSHLHQSEAQIINVQSRPMLASQIQEGKTKSCMEQISRFMAWMVRKSGLELSGQLICYLRDRIADHKQEALRKYMVVLQAVLAIHDQQQTNRCGGGATLFLKAFSNHNSVTFGSDFNFDIIWLWFLAIARTNTTFANRIKECRSQFDFLLTKDYGNSGFCKSDRNGNIPKTRHRVHDINIPEPGQAIASHSRKVQITKNLLNPNIPWKLGPLPATSLTCLDLQPGDCIFRLNEISQKFESLSVRWTMGDLIAVNSVSSKEKYPQSHYVLRGDDRLSSVDCGKLQIEDEKT